MLYLSHIRMLEEGRVNKQLLFILTSYPLSKTDNRHEHQLLVVEFSFFSRRVTPYPSLKSCLTTTF